MANSFFTPDILTKLFLTRWVNWRVPDKEGSVHFDLRFSSDDLLVPIVEFERKHVLPNVEMYGLRYVFGLGEPSVLLEEPEGVQSALTFYRGWDCRALFLPSFDDTDVQIVRIDISKIITDKEIAESEAA